MLRLPAVTTLRKQLALPAVQQKPFDIWRAGPKVLSIEAQTSDFKYLAQPINRLMDAQLIDQRVRP